MPKSKTRAQKRIARELRSVVAPEERQSIIEELEEQVEKEVQDKPKGRIPGLILGSTKLTYTYQDLSGMFPIVSFTPEETIPLTYQGVKVQAYANVLMHVPECFKKLYDQHRREQRVNLSQLKELGIDVELGAGTL